MKFFAIMALSCLLVLAACGGDDDDTGNSDAGDPGEFATELVQTMIKGQWGRAYESLYPDYQEIVDRDLYIQCQSKTTLPEMSVSVDETYAEPVTLKNGEQVDATAVTLKLGDGDSAAFQTFHMIEVDGSWRWPMQNDSLTAYEAGNCP